MVDDPYLRQRAISSIKVGERHRREQGDIDGLASSIKSIGLLHPIVIKPNGKLIAGHRRLAACRQLGWWDIPVTVIDIDAIVHGEFAENTFRKDFTLSEAVAIKRDNPVRLVGREFAIDVDRLAPTVSRDQLPRLL